MTDLTLSFPEAVPGRRPAPAAPASADHADASAFLRHCAAEGVVFRVDGADLLVQASTPLTPALRTRIQAMKPALLERLTTHRCTGCQGETLFPAPTLCFWCRHPEPSTSAAG